METDGVSRPVTFVSCGPCVIIHAANLVIRRRFDTQTIFVFVSWFTDKVLLKFRYIFIFQLKLIDKITVQLKSIEIKSPEKVYQT